MNERFKVIDADGNEQVATCTHSSIGTSTLDGPDSMQGLPSFQLPSCSLKPVDGDGRSPGDVFEDPFGNRYIRR